MSGRINKGKTQTEGRKAKWKEGWNERRKTLMNKRTKEEQNRLRKDGKDDVKN